MHVGESICPGIGPIILPSTAARKDSATGGHIEPQAHPKLKPPGPAGLIDPDPRFPDDTA